MEDREGLDSLLAYINRHRGIDFGLYRHATILRKLGLRLQAAGNISYAGYLSYLMANPAEMEDLIGALTIKATSFFRDPTVFDLLYSHVMPGVISRFGYLRIWSLGCAGGEEPYSLAMIAGDILKEDKGSVNVEITGTDIDAAAIEKAARGEYPESAMTGVSGRHAKEFFSRKDRVWVISDRIRSMVRFERDDLVAGLKRAGRESRTCHIILCRNVLIYMNRALREEVLSNIADVLCPGGYVVLGETETLPRNAGRRFAQAFAGVKIYRRKPPLSCAP